MMTEMAKTRLHRRNTKAVEETLRKQDTLIRNQQQEIDNLKSQIGSLFGRMNGLEDGMGRLRATRMGNGPTA